ncbi:hypothetical protein MMC28_006954 [Mycoblastus sanguinarius]|nr:hypothetical protein [Mycoblastus sanguinarius]
MEEHQSILQSSLEGYQGLCEVGTDAVASSGFNSFSGQAQCNIRAGVLERLNNDHQNDLPPADQRLITERNWEKAPLSPGSEVIRSQRYSNLDASSGVSSPHAQQTIMRENYSDTRPHTQSASARSRASNLLGPPLEYFSSALSNGQMRSADPSTISNISVVQRPDFFTAFSHPHGQNFEDPNAQIPVIPEDFCESSWPWNVETSTEHRPISYDDFRDIRLASLSTFPSDALEMPSSTFSPAYDYNAAVLGSWGDGMELIQDLFQHQSQEGEAELQSSMLPAWDIFPDAVGELQSFGSY